MSKVIAGPTEHLVARSDYETLRDERDRLRGLLQEIAFDCEHVGSIQHLDKAERRTWVSVANRIKAALTPAGQRWTRSNIQGFWPYQTTGRLYAWEHVQCDGVWYRREWLCAIERHWIDGVLTPNEATE